jgi:hypothetical protein
MEIERSGGAIESGIAAAARWAARELPLYSINCLLATTLGLWALRYPEINPLLMLERAIGGPSGRRHLDAASAAGTVRVRSRALADRAAVVFASEEMDEDPGWRSVEPGETSVADDGRRLIVRRAGAGRRPSNAGPARERRHDRPGLRADSDRARGSRSRCTR